MEVSDKHVQYLLGLLPGQVVGDYANAVKVAMQLALAIKLKDFDKYIDILKFNLDYSNTNALYNVAHQNIYRTQLIGSCCRYYFEQERR